MRGDHTVARAGVLDSGYDYVILAVVTVTVVGGGGTWLTGQLAGLLFSSRWPHVTFPQALAATVALPAHLADPRQAWPASARAALPGLPGFAIAGLPVLAALTFAAVAAARQLAGRWPRRGMASHRDLAHALTEAAVLRKAATIRPSMAGMKPAVTDAGVRVGRAVPGGMPLAVSAEDSVVVLAAPRTGKSTQVIIPWLRDWPGPALVTSIRPDVLLATATLREKRGPVAVMAPTDMITWPETLTWDPSSGCDSFDKSRSRADVMVTVGKSQATSDSNDGGFFGQNATNLLAGWLHAAGVSGGSMRDVLRWAFDERVDEPIRILAASPYAADGTATMLDSLYRLPADTTRSSLWATAQTAIAPLLAPAARDIFVPGPGQTTSLHDFLQAGGTCYLIADERRASALAPVVSAFADDLIETAAAIAATSAGSRLDPPLFLALDEVANIVPLPQLPALMSFAGGTGIFVTAVLQALSQAKARWGHDAASTLWGASTVKIVLGGLAGDDLREISELAGEYRETLITWQRGHGGHTLSSTLQDRKAMTPSAIRTLSAQRREALILHATTPPVIARMTRHYEGPHRLEYEAAVMEARRIAGIEGA